MIRSSSRWTDFISIIEISREKKVGESVVTAKNTIHLYPLLCKMYPLNYLFYWRASILESWYY